MADTPVRSGTVDLSLGATQLAGPYARLEAALRPWERVAAFGFGQVDRAGWQAGAGLRATFGW